MTRGLDWRWVAIGTAIMFGLNLAAGLILLPLLGGVEAVPANAGGAPAAAADPALGIGGGCSWPPWCRS